MVVTFTADARLKRSIPGTFTAFAQLRQLPTPESDFFSAYLVDCDIVKKRKLELQSFSPAELQTRIGESAFDESRSAIPLRNLLEAVRDFSTSTTAHPSTDVDRAKNKGGRKKLPNNKRSFHAIGVMVADAMPRMQKFMRLRNELSQDSSLNHDDIKSQLLRRGCGNCEVEAILESKTVAGAAKRLVACQSHMSLTSVQSSYSRYIRQKNDPSFKA